ncbi:hypothetical protein, partial [Rhizobium leguminosarum]|uniref:hypothetical protein n=1 Tax=Rhizobium leguminosarum TaxID=384 RepID=UPI003F9746B1
NEIFTNFRTVFRFMTLFRSATDNYDINASRARRRRNMMATLLLSQGVPMILAGEELGNIQEVNNTAYCQDNEIGWTDWAGLD